MDTNMDIDTDMGMKMDIHNYIGGELTPSHDRLENINPATGAVSGTLPNASDDDVAQAVAAAQKAFPAWSRRSPEARAEILEAIANEIDAQCTALAEAESRDNGKPIHVAAAVDIPRSANNFRFFARACTQFSSESHASADGLNVTLRQPLGVVACISPWNLPLYLLTWKIAPALAAGNCVVAKPSEVTPLTAFLLAKICIKVGLPPGVLNIIHGRGASCGNTLCQHEAVKAISFTGGSETGRAIAIQAAQNFKKVSLELGGKNPSIVFADADLDKAIAGTFRAAFSNMGQICLCGSRIYVARNLYESFKQHFIEKTKALNVGDPAAPTSDHGALVSQQHLEKVAAAVDQARAEGGQILCGGQRIQFEGPLARGNFYAPTVIEGLGPQSTTNRNEIFGPVVSIQPFNSDAEAIAAANATPYGLAANIWTRDIHRAHHVANSIDFGIVWINTWMQRDLRTPFGGMKQSGIGREGGVEAMRFFTECKNICIAYEAQS